MLCVEFGGDHLSVHSWTQVRTAALNILCFSTVNVVSREHLGWVFFFSSWLTFSDMRSVSGDIERGNGRDKDNQGEVCEGYLYQVSQGIT